VFSPYKDGKYNQAKISYNVPSGSQITIRVFDITGREVRNLVDHIDGGGASATISWDGKDDDGNVVRTGIYIVNIESVNKTTGETRRSSKRAVVGRKM
jgi:flagellar hook assembly protein FlgD